ncbi:MAG TPA: CHAT domain-containing protein, partial [Vicinamibacterales bacterium]
MQRRLAGSDVVVLEVVALPGEIATIAVSGRDVVAGRRVLGEESIAALVRAASGEQPLPALEALYDAIVRPVDAALAGRSRLVVVADPVLEGVPFAALFDRGQRRYLVERTAVAIAPSAAALMRGASPHRASSAVVVGLPSGTVAATAALPQSEVEVREIGRLYAHAVSIPPGEATWMAFTRAAASNGVDVVHIAGHAQRQQGSGDAALLFADAPVSWKSIGAAPRMDVDVVVLAACETLRRPLSENTRALTLAEAFATAGARAVAGTLVPIADVDARELFRSFHRRLVSGDDAIDALRRVQLDAIHTGTGRPGFPPWAALSVLTTRIPSSGTLRGVDHE